MKQITKKAFSLIEVIVWIVIFLIGISSVYAVIRSTMNINMLNKDYIIASNLAREQVELVRNIRDTNFAKIQAYNVLKPETTDFSDTNRFKVWEYYKINNDFSPTATNFIQIEKKGFAEWETSLSSNSDFKICLNSENLYDYCNNISWDKKKTPFYKYIKIEKVKDKSGSTVSGAFQLISKVAWKTNKYHEFYIKAIFTDYKIF